MLNNNQFDLYEKVFTFRDSIWDLVFQQIDSHLETHLRHQIRNLVFNHVELEVQQLIEFKAQNEI